MTRPLYPHPSGWRVASLEVNPSGDVITSAKSGSTPPTGEIEHWGGTFPWLTPKEVTQASKNRCVGASERTLTSLGVTRAGGLRKAGTVLLTKRAPVGIAVINQLPMAINQGFLSFECGQALDPEFLYYWLLGNGPYLDAVADGSTYPELYAGDLFELEIAFPSRNDQQQIVSVLKALDEKIELNRRMNATLETIVQSVFKSWFVDAAQNGLPQGWRKDTLGEVTENLRRGIQPNQIEAKKPYIALEHIPRRCISLSEWGEADSLESNKFEFKRGEILFGKLRPYFHKVGVAPIDGVCSTDILVIRPKKPEWFGFVLGHVASVDLVNYTDAASTGTKMPRTSWEDLARFEVALPPENLAADFTKRIRPLINRIISNIHESRTLASLRDTLLPRLLSGELPAPVYAREQHNVLHAP
jgi:restriction endonuclease S subunit